MAVEYPLSERQYERALLDSAVSHETSLSALPLGIGKLFYRLDMHFREEGSYAYDREQIVSAFGKSTGELESLGRRLCRVARTKIEENLPVDIHELYSGIVSPHRFVQILQDDRNIFHILNFFHCNYVSEEDVKDEALSTLSHFLKECDHAEPKAAGTALSIYKFLHEKKHGGVVQRVQTVNLNQNTRTPDVFLPMSDKAEALAAMDKQLAQLKNDSTKAELTKIVDAEVVK